MTQKDISLYFVFCWDRDTPRKLGAHRLYSQIEAYNFVKSNGPSICFIAKEACEPDGFPVAYIKRIEPEPKEVSK